MSEFGFLTASAPNGGAIVPGVTPIIGGAVGQILFQGAGNVVQESANLFWDNTNGRLGIGTSIPSRTLDIAGNQLITYADVANPDVGPAAFQITNGTFAKFAIINDANRCRVNMLGTSTQGLRIESGSNTNISVIGGGGLTLSSTSNNFSISANAFLLNTAGSERMRIPNTGNVLINTTTDAGFRLDVNGTARTQQLHTFLQGTYLDANTSNNYHRVYTGASTYGGLQLQNEIVNYTGYITTGRSGNQLGINFFHTTYAGGVSASSHQKFTQGGVQFGSLSLPNTLTVFNVGGGNGTVNYPIVANNQLNTTNTGVGYLFQTGDITGSGPINHAAISAWKTNSAAPSITSSLRFYTISDAANSLTEKMRIADSGNVLINTTTDAGFRLDVNGTARVQGQATITNGLLVTGGILRASNLAGAQTAFTVVDDNGTFVRNANWKYNRDTFNTWINGSEQTSSLFTLNSTTQGFLPPRMTTAQKNAIASPATGLMVYDTDLNRPCFYNGTTWITL